MISLLTNKYTYIALAVIGVLFYIGTLKLQVMSTREKYTKAKANYEILENRFGLLREGYDSVNKSNERLLKTIDDLKTESGKIQVIYKDRIVYQKEKCDEIIDSILTPRKENEETNSDDPVLNSLNGLW